MFSVSFIISVLIVANSANLLKDKNEYNRCILPKDPRNGHLSVGTNKTSEGEVDNGVVISTTCNNGYKLNGSPTSRCNNGKWSANIGQCLELCPPIVEKHSTKVICTTNGKNSDCNKPTNGTIAIMECAPFYENEELNRNPFRICKNGRWNEEILYCSAVCGVEPASLVNGTSTLQQFYPWNILIYFKTYNGEVVKLKVCVGTLINENTILTSAFCLHVKSLDKIEIGDKDKVYLDLDRLAVAAGKMVYEFIEPDPEVQYSSVKVFFVPGTYRGYREKFHSDIAVLITGTPFKMTRRVQPVCIDWSNKYKNKFRDLKTPGKVAAPLNSINHSMNSTTIFGVEVALLNEVECNELLDIKLRNLTDSSSYYHFFYTTKDKYCATYISSWRHSACIYQISLGVGLATINAIDGKYYIIGVASFGSLYTDPCTTNGFSLFTRISEYIDFISEKTKVYSPTERVQLQTSCGVKSVQIEPEIGNGTTVAKSAYPWQVVIYKISSSQKNLICGGTLINERVILTAAHCITNENGERLPKEKYVIAAGKLYRNFDDPRDSNSQFSAVKEIIVPTEYKGRLQNYLSNIAILISENSFIITREIQPICVDWGARYENQFLKPNNTGFAAGWEFTSKNQSLSKELTNLEVSYSYIDQEQCKNKIPSDLKNFLTNDKFCSRLLNKGKRLCHEVGGGGIFFINKKDSRYYLAGVFSISPPSLSSECNSQQYALYTQVSKYIKKFIRETVGHYWS